MGAGTDGAFMVRQRGLFHGNLLCGSTQSWPLEWSAVSRAEALLMIAIHPRPENSEDPAVPVFAGPWWSLQLGP